MDPLEDWLEAFRSIDQKYIAADQSRKVILANEVSRLADQLKESDKAKTPKNALVYQEANEYLADFGWRRGAESESDFITVMVKQIKGGVGYKKGIAGLLAWLCHQHKDVAETIYRETGLAKEIGIPFRTYEGEPGQAASDRAPIPSSMQHQAGKDLRTIKGQLSKIEASEADTQSEIRQTNRKLDEASGKHDTTHASLDGLHEKLDGSRLAQDENRRVFEQFANEQRQRAGSANREKSPTEQAWDIVKKALTVSPYQDFIERHGDHELATKAHAHIRDLQLWADIPQDNPWAVREFTISGPFRALGEHAEAQLDLAKEAYVEERVKLVSERMRAFAGPQTILGGVGMLALIALGYYLAFGFIATCWQAASRAVRKKDWPLPDAATDIGRWWDSQLNGSLGDLIVRLGIDASAWPRSEEFGIWLQTLILFVLIIVVILTILFRYAYGKFESISQDQDRQIEAIRSHHREKVADL